MTWCRRAALLLLPLLVLVSIPERPTSAVQTTAAVRFPPPDVAERNDILLDNRVPIPMRDGVSLYADVYRPVGNERYPVIVSRTPYSTERFPSAYEAGVYFSRRGYVYVFQDVRGRHESDGRWEPFFDDERDGYEPRTDFQRFVLEKGIAFEAAVPNLFGKDPDFEAASRT